MSFKNLKKIDIFRAKTPDEDIEDLTAEMENCQQEVMERVKTHLLKSVISYHCILAFNLLFINMIWYHDLKINLKIEDEEEMDDVKEKTEEDVEPSTVEERR